MQRLFVQCISSVGSLMFQFQSNEFPVILIYKNKSSLHLILSLRFHVSAGPYRTVLEHLREWAFRGWLYKPYNVWCLACRLLPLEENGSRQTNHQSHSSWNSTKGIKKHFFFKSIDLIRTFLIHRSSTASCSWSMKWQRGIKYQWSVQLLSALVPRYLNLDQTLQCIKI